MPFPLWIAQEELDRMNRIFQDLQNRFDILSILKQLVNPVYLRADVVVLV
jgi:hypothetical protein